MAPPSEPGASAASNTATGCTELLAEKEVDCEEEAEASNFVFLPSVRLLFLSRGGDHRAGKLQVAKGDYYR